MSRLDEVLGEILTCDVGTLPASTPLREVDGFDSPRHVMLVVRRESTLRGDEPGALDVLNEGWDTAMIEHPCVFDHAGERYMLHAGNGFGRARFGLAVLR